MKVKVLFKGNKVLGEIYRGFDYTIVAGKPSLIEEKELVRLQKLFPGDFSLVVELSQDEIVHTPPQMLTTTPPPPQCVTPPPPAKEVPKEKGKRGRKPKHK